MKKLISLFYLIAQTIKRIASRIEQSRRQSERDELEANPGEFMSHHFGGVQHKPADADKADAKRNPKK